MSFAIRGCLLTIQKEILLPNNTQQKYVYSRAMTAKPPSFPALLSTPVHGRRSLAGHSWHGTRNSQAVLQFYSNFLCLSIARVLICLGCTSKFSKYVDVKSLMQQNHTFQCVRSTDQCCQGYHCPLHHKTSAMQRLGLPLARVAPHPNPLCSDQNAKKWRGRTTTPKHIITFH